MAVKGSTGAAEDEPALRMAVERVHSNVNRIRQETVVGVEEDHVLASRRGEAGISRDGRSLIALAQTPNATGPRCDAGRIVRRSVVDDDDVGALALRVDARERLAQIMRLVEARNDDGDRHRAPLRR